ncbi:MAG: IMP dehydrogenase [Anaerolineales bacterium]|nr:IMP dehydrogenase [Anaerolineales bacterium]
MMIRESKGLTFDDVLLIPKRSNIASRGDVDTSSSLTKSINLRVPVISANMDTVTEADMAIAMARAGGMGILHRFMTIEQQVRQVQRVKRAEGLMVENPYAIHQSATIQEAKKQMKSFDVGGLVITNGGDELIGLITQRDVLFAPDAAAPVSSVMTRPGQIISVKPGITPEEARRVLHEHRLEKLPVIDDEGRFVGLITSQDLIKHEQHPHASKDERGRLRVGAAIGVQPHDLDRAGALLDAGVDVLVLDIAHGHAEHCIRMVKSLRKDYPKAQVIAGNVASVDGAKDLAEAGADAIKVGIGPGSICTTRIVTGFGVPQLTAIMDSVAGLRDARIDIPVIADGGIRTSGDMVKALAAGASTVMIGSLFAGCEEAPGSPVIRDGQKVKVVRGMASLGAAISRKERERDTQDESAESQEDWDKVVPEGVEAVVPYRGHVREILYQMVGGLRSGLSYGGAHTIRELQENAEFIQITPAGIRESSHHDVGKL